MERYANIAALTTALTVLATSLPALAVEADAVIGTWVTAGGSSQVSIRQQGELYVGQISVLKQPLYRHGETAGPRAVRGWMRTTPTRGCGNGRCWGCRC